MIICDRCGCKHAKYNVFIGDKKGDLCSDCLKKYDDLSKILNDIERDFMRAKFTTIKHIDFV